MAWGAGSSRLPGLSPGNYRNKQSINFYINSKKKKISLEKRWDKPQLSASKGDIFYVFFYLQHEQSYHIANKESFHLSRSKRKLQEVSQKTVKILCTKRNKSRF